jgi:hypothetical protein
MASNKEKIKQLRTTADASAKYRDKWLSVDNWIELITNHNSDSALTSQELNRALARDYPTKSLMDTKEGTVNYTGIFRDTKYETKEGNTCRITYHKKPMSTQLMFEHHHFGLEEMPRLQL